MGEMEAGLVHWFRGLLKTFFTRSGSLEMDGEKCY